MRYSEGTEGLCWTQGQDGPKPLTPPRAWLKGGAPRALKARVLIAGAGATPSKIHQVNLEGSTRH